MVRPAGLVAVVTEVRSGIAGMPDLHLDDLPLRPPAVAWVRTANPSVTLAMSICPSAARKSSGRNVASTRGRRSAVSVRATTSA
jgi:hypothetical protein